MHQQYDNSNKQTHSWNHYLPTYFFYHRANKAQYPAHVRGLKMHIENGSIYLK